MPSPKLQFILAAFDRANLAGPGYDAAVRIAADPRTLLSAYAFATCSACVVLHLWRGHEAQGVLPGGVRLVSILSLAFAPFCFLATGNAMASVAMAASGVLGFGSASIIRSEENRRRRETASHKAKKAP